jgi:hypothetical protein
MGTLLIVDAANVVGSTPDGWWRDRAGATARLRDRLAAGLLPVTEPEIEEVVLVVEGKARDVAGVPGVRVHAAPGSGDDTIVDLVRDADDTRTAIYVVTADRALRHRVEALGARVLGPRSLPRG